MRSSTLIRLLVSGVFTWIVFALLFGTGPLGAQEEIGVRPGDPPRASDEFVPGQLVVKFKAGVSRPDSAAAVEREGAVLLRDLLLPRYSLVSVPSGREQEFRARLEGDPAVEMAEPNGIDRATFTPNDLYYSLQWHMPQVQSEQAWDVANGSGVVVAVVDTGVAYENHGVYAQAPDLAGTSFTAGHDFVNGDSHPNDDNGHGTHVAGTVAQTTNNSLGVAGLAFGATIMPVKVLDSQGSGTHADMADGFTWATNHGADIINYSSGGSHSTTKEDAVNYALSHGVVVVAAAGNANTSSLDCPACYPGVIAVGATDYNMNRSYYSNYGCGRDGHCLDVVAPGGDTTADLNGDEYADGVLQQTFKFACTGGTHDFTDFVYCFFEGTSMATPHVAAAAALLLDANPSLLGQQVGTCLRKTALDRGAPGYDTTYGYGLIQARAALDACLTVGGVAELPDTVAVAAEEAGVPAEGSGWSAGAYAGLVGALAAGALAIGGGGWYTMRRRLR
jgi:serine protease